MSSTSLASGPAREMGAVMPNVFVAVEDAVVVVVTVTDIFTEFHIMQRLIQDKLNKGGGGRGRSR